MAAPDGLFSGPVVDGQPTWYGPAVAALKAGYEMRGHELDAWRLIDDEHDFPAGRIVQARPAQQPDPSYLTRFVVEGRTHWVTWVEAMRGRTDLDQWEWADPWHGHWQQRVVVLTDAVPPDDFPVIVRRRT